MIKKMCDFFLRNIGWFIFICFFVIIPIYYYFHLVLVLGRKWNHLGGLGLWIMPMIFLLFSYVGRYDFFSTWKFSERGIEIKYLGKIVENKIWDNFISGEIQKHTGRMMQYWIILLYKPMAITETMCTFYKPGKQPYICFALDVEQYTKLLLYLSPDIIKDSKDAREWALHYNKVMRERAKKEARKAERKRLREYK